MLETLGKFRPSFTPNQINRSWIPETYRKKSSYGANLATNYKETLISPNWKINFLQTTNSCGSTMIPSTTAIWRTPVKLKMTKWYNFCKLFFAFRLSKVDQRGSIYSLLRKKKHTHTLPKDFWKRNYQQRWKPGSLSLD